MARRSRPFMARQGDVLITRVADTARPTDLAAVPPDRHRVILAYGEVTGHAHALPATDAVRYGPSDDAFWLVVSADTAVTHEEHAPIPLTPGTYRVRRQREYTPERIVQVAD